MNHPFTNSQISNIIREGALQIENIPNFYGTNKLVFKVVSEKKNQYFLKISRTKSLTEANAYSRLHQYLPTADLVYSGYLSPNVPVIIYRFVDGTLMTDTVLSAEESGEYSNSIAIEDSKNSYLADMYKKSAGEITIKEYMNSPTNEVFYKRLQGNRFKTYYSDNSILSTRLRKKIILNRQTLGYCDKIISNIRKKYEQKPKLLRAVLGHGDAHHQNIIHKPNGQLCFTDFEYSGYIPIGMEISKPYYIDLLGTLFFFFEDKLLSHFDFISINETSEAIDMNIKIHSVPQLRIALAENKILHFQKFMNQTIDILTVNDYIVLSHLLSRDPNQYSDKAQQLFLIFTILLSEFNLTQPSSLFEAFN